MISNFKFKISNYSKAFTMIEVLVVVSVISVLIAVAISNFPSARLQFALSRATYKFEQDVRRAQNLALSSVEYKDENGVVQNISGYGVFVDIGALGNKKYILYADKSPGNQQYDGADYLIQTIDFSQNEPGIIIKQIDNVIGDSASVNLNTANLVTNVYQLDLPQNTAKFIFAIETQPEKVKSVWVNTSGLVEVK